MSNIKYQKFVFFSFRYKNEIYIFTIKNPNIMKNVNLKNSFIVLLFACSFVFCILQNLKLLEKSYTFELSLVSRLSLDKLFWIWLVILAIIYINSVYALSKYCNIYSILQKLTSTEKRTILY